MDENTKLVATAAFITRHKKQYAAGEVTEMSVEESGDTLIVNAMVGKFFVEEIYDKNAKLISSEKEKISNRAASFKATKAGRTALFSAEYNNQEQLFLRIRGEGIVPRYHRVYGQHTNDSVSKMLVEYAVEKGYEIVFDKAITVAKKEDK